MRWLILGLFALAGGCASVAAPVAPVVLAEGEGVVRVNCRVQEDGQLTRCRILSEQPRGLGHGERALRAAGQARLDTGMAWNLSPGAEVEYSIRFRPDDPAPTLDLQPPRA